MIELDPFTIIVSLLSVGAFTVPVIYKSSQAKNSESNLQKKFQEFSAEKNIQIEIQEHWRRRYSIGLDISDKKILYRKLEPNPELAIVNLAEIKKVSLVEKCHAVGEKRERRTVIDYVAIQFQPINPEQETINLEFYDAELFSDLMGERVLAEKWAAMLNQIIHS